MELEDSRKTQKSKYRENETLFFLQVKKLVHYTLRAKLWQKIVLQRRGNLLSFCESSFFVVFES